MAIEIEKKYRLTAEQFESLPEKLKSASAEYVGEDFEVNEIYGGGILTKEKAVLRLRKVDEKTVLTFKRRVENEAAVKKQIEHETEIADIEAMREIIESLGFRQVLIYEKRRRTWRIAQTEIVLDELPFGFFMEIEGAETEIGRIEKTLAAEDFSVEHRTYPELTKLFGEPVEKTFRAEFAEKS